MKFLSVCSGIEAASVAWAPLDWSAAAFSEIEPFPCSLLAHRFPDTPNFGDMTKYKDWPDDLSIDLLCGGTPCQSFSVAGLRKGLADPRGNLMLTFGAIAAKYRPQWLVWENVPGVLSSNGGRDFGAFLGMLGQLGYGFAYRVLDAQHFGVPQRRRRVFVVGCLGDWRSAAAVLFERHSLSGHPAPRREKGKNVAGTFGARASSGGGFSTDFECSGGVIATLCVATGQAGAEIGADMAPTLNCNHETPYIARSLRGEGFDASEDGTGRGTPLVPLLPFDTTQCTHPANHSNPQAVAFNMHKSGNAASGLGISQDRTDCLMASEKAPFAGQPAAGMQVRRLTPRECERLQGFPDDWTNVPHRGKSAADGPRYKALGNSWAVPVARWVGERIAAVDAIALRQNTKGENQ